MTSKQKPSNFRQQIIKRIKKLIQFRIPLLRKIHQTIQPGFKNSRNRFKTY